MRWLRRLLAPDRTPASKYVAAPPAPLAALGWRHLISVPWKLALSLLFLLRHTLSPYTYGPTEPTADPPDLEREFTTAQLDQCKRIYEEVEATHAALEDKAKAVFSLITFLVPASAGTAIYILGRAKLETVPKLWAMGLLLLVSVLLLLAYTAASRALFVRQRSHLFLASVIDEEKGEFRTFNAAFYARGLLWCASMNAATNSHISEFTKAAQAFTTLAAVSLAAVAVPVGDSLLQPAEELATIEGSISVPQIEMLTVELRRSASASRDVADRLSNLESEALRIENRVVELESEFAKRPTVRTTEPAGVSEDRPKAGPVPR